MSIVKKIKKLSLTVLGCEAEPWDNVWARVKELSDAFGQDKVADAFDEWAQLHRGQIIRKPVEEWLKIAPGLIQGITSLKPNPALTKLVDDFAYEADRQGLAVFFDSEQQVQIGRLLADYTENELRAAYKEFLGTLDDFTVKFAAKNFVEKAGQLLALQKRRKSDADKQASLLVQLTDKEARKVQEEQAELARKQESELDLVEDTLGELMEIGLGTPSDPRMVVRDPNFRK